MKLEVNDLLKTARQRTGLSDFGPDDFMEGFKVVVDGINNEVDVRETSEGMLRERLLRLLMNRQWFADDLAKYPEILEQELAPPIVISSLPRTASTKLHRMLGASGAFQVLPLWKIHMFARIPGLENGGEAQRIQQTQEYEDWVYKASPTMLTGHAIFTHEPEEEMLLSEFTFRHSILFGILEMPSYAQWLATADMTPTYDYLGAQLKYLQWQNKLDSSKPWLLKTPCHFGYEDRLIELFGDAKFLVTHRDPCKCIPSIASTTLGWRGMYSDTSSSANTGAAMSEMFSYGATQHMQWRDKNPNIKILDIGFDETAKNGSATVRKVFDFLEMPLSQEHVQAMQSWEAKNGPNKHGKHQYSAEQIGTTDEEIAQLFTAYTERFSEFL